MNTEIKALNPNVKGMKLIVPFDGTIEINAEGVATVSERAAEALVKGTNDWEYTEKDNPKSKTENTESNVEKSEDEMVVAGIKKMKLDEMLNMAREAGYSEKEWKRFAEKEKLMAAYLIKKYNEAKLAEGEDNAE